MKILVTGGAGYIGAILVPELLKKEHEVIVVDSLMYQQTSLLDVCFHSKLSLIRGDVRDDRILKNLISKVDAILPLACLTGAPICEREAAAAKAINYDAIQKILAMKSRDQILIFPSTNSGYGVGEKDVYCDEDSPMRPISLYARLKVDIEEILLERGDCVTMRFATVFGASPRMRLDLLVNDFTYRAVTDRFIVLFEPHFKRNYLHIRDAAAAFVHALDHYESMKGRPYNVGISNANLSKWELCELIKKHVSEFYFVAAEIGGDPDKRNYIVSNARMESTGFKTAIGIDQGIQELLKAFQMIRRNQHSNI